MASDPPPGVIWATPINDDFEQTGPPRPLLEPLPAEDSNHVWAPSLIVVGDKLYMFYDSGPRLNCKIRYASTPLPTSKSTSSQP